MLMSPDHRVVHAHLPPHVADRAALGLSVRQEAIPGTVAPPAVEAIEAGLPGTVPFWEVAPGRAGPQLPEDAVDDGAMVAPLTAPLTALSGKERLYLLPSLVGDLPAPETMVVPPVVACPLGERDTTDPAIRQTGSSLLSTVI
jgi:hypothetical protein